MSDGRPESLVGAPVESRPPVGDKPRGSEVSEREVDYFQRGLEALVAAGWLSSIEDREPPVGRHSKAFWAYVVEHLWGRLWSRPGLSLVDRQIATLATLILKGDWDELSDHLRRCHALGFSEEKVRSTIVLVGYYAGWPRMQTAMNCFDLVLEDPECSWPSELRSTDPERPFVYPGQSQDRAAWYEAGLETLLALGWIKDTDSRLPSSPDGDQRFWNHTIENLFGHGYALPALSVRERQLVVMATIIGHNNDEGIKTHFLRCHHVGFTELEVREVLLQVGYYGGWPCFSVGTIRLNRLLRDPSSDWPPERRLELPELGSAPEWTQEPLGDH